VAGLSPHISLRLVEDGLPGDLLPELEICPQEPEPRKRGIVYLGIPSGYEFSSLVQDILMAGHGDSGLNQTTREALEKLAEPVRIQVFVTPTCPYCPGAVHLAHQMAYQSDLVQAEMIEAMEFPELAQKFGVMGVPRTVINDRQHVEGAVPEAVLLEQVLAAVGSPERDLMDA
jgi:glutaredoxin-like protein